ncbi:MAG: error-prone DNA polymerase [Pseudomonadota bacterium]
MSGMRLVPQGDQKPPLNPPSAYVELAVQSCFSFGRGAAHAHELAIRAHALGYDAIGITDVNTLAGIVRMHRDAKTARMRPIIGCRLEPLDGPPLLVWPKNDEGYGRLCRIISQGRMAAGDESKGNIATGKDCALTLSDIADLAEGMIFATAPPRDIEALEQALPHLLNVLPLTHMAASHRYGGDDHARIERMDRLAKANGLSLLATNDVLYAYRAQRPLQDVIACIRERVTIAQAGFLVEANGERHLKSPQEMCRLFAPWPHAIAATRQIADACTFTLDTFQYQYPNEPVPEGKTPDAWLRHLSYEGARDRYGDNLPVKVRALIEKELALIARKKIARYFLTVRDIVVFARTREKPILCQGRGSAANSAVCYCLGITNVDPASTEVLFERFISEARDEPPDIDVDFEHERREEVIQHIYRRYGRERAGLCATVIHYRPRSAIREVGRVMGLSEHVTTALAKTVWGSWGTGIVEEQIKEAGLDPTDPHLRRTVRLSGELMGLPRHLSQHVGGFVLTEGPLVETVPIRWGAMPDRSYIEWDKDDIDALGIFKIDVLALGMLTAIRKSFDMVQHYLGETLDLAEIGLEENSEPRVYDMLEKADSLGVFQIESRAQMAMLPRLKPRCFYDLVIEVAIVRPGPIQGDMVHPFLKRREGSESVSYPTPGPEYPQDELKNILQRTLGVPIFQEQAMAIAMEAAEFNAHDANELRRAMATFRSRGTIAELQGRMVGNMVKRGYDPHFAQRCFDQIKGFGEYGFPESHAASFAHLVYVSCWLKWRYPDVFAAALLNSQPMGFYAPAQIVRDARAHGVDVRPPDVNLSDWNCTLTPIDPDDRLPGEGLNGVCRPSHAMRLGLRLVDGFGEASARTLLQTRANTPFLDVADLHGRTRLPRDVIERLAAADAFRSCGLSRRDALWQCRGLDDAAPTPFVPAGDEKPVQLPLMPPSEEVVADYQTTRLSLKAHPLSFLRQRYSKMGITRSDHMIAASGMMKKLDRGYQARRSIEVAGFVLQRQRPGSAKGVCFLTLEDEAGTVNVIVWPKVMERFRPIVMASRLMRVRGHVQCADNVTHLVAKHLIDASDDIDFLSDAELHMERLRSDHVDRPLKTSRQEPPIRVHPRNVRVIPKAREFH